MIDPEKPNFGGTPVDPWRARLSYRPEDAGGSPALSIVTPVYDPGAPFRETVKSVMRQSLQQWEWIVVDDGSPIAAREWLEAFALRDPRIRLIRNAERLGRAAACNTGFAAARTDFVYRLDPDELLEPTALEKSLWFLVAHPGYAFANGWSMVFGARRYLWSSGFEQERAFLDENHAPGPALIRRSTFETAGNYDETLANGEEDWELWMRCADRGLWGATIPETLHWIRRDDGERPERCSAFREELRQRHPRLFDRGFPRVPHASELEGPAAERLPFANRLKRRLRRLLVVAPQLDVDAAGALLLEAVQLLSKHGWEITVASAGTGRRKRRGT